MGRVRPLVVPRERWSKSRRRRPGWFRRAISLCAGSGISSPLPAKACKSKVDTGERRHVERTGIAALGDEGPPEALKVVLLLLLLRFSFLPSRSACWAQT